MICVSVALTVVGCGTILNLRDDYVEAGDAAADGSVADGAAPTSDATLTDGALTDGSPSADAGADADAALDVDAYVWTPAALDPNTLSLWLTARSGVAVDGGNVVAWNDRSTHHNDMLPRADGGALTSPTMGKNGSRPTVGFSSATRTLLLGPDSPSLQVGTMDFSVSVVGRYQNGVGSDPDLDRALFIGKRCSGPGTPGWGLYGNFGAPGGSGIEGYTSTGPVLTAADAGYNDHVTRLIEMRKVSNVLNVRVNGAQVATGPAVDNVSSTGCLLSIGVQIPDADHCFLDGDIEEIVVLKGTPTVAEFANLEAYLKAQHGLP